jgi:predicted metal-dependent phosphoesterase TrpH
MAAIDLHTHTTISDGKYSPGALVQKANNIGLVAIAITDHDDIRGIDLAMQAGEKFGIEIVPGIELSASRDPDNDIKQNKVHLIGLYINACNINLATYCKKMYEARVDQSNQMIEKIKKYVYPSFSVEELKDFAIETPAKYDISEYLVFKGVIGDKWEAMREFFGEGKIADIKFNSKKLSVKEGIDLIHNSGGVAIWAHPLWVLDSRHKKFSSLELSEQLTQLEEMAINFQELGLDGVETYYHYDTTLARNYMNNIDEWVNKYQFIESGGSDFHRDDDKYPHELGRVCNNKQIPYFILEKIKNRMVRMKKCKIY